jgi:hypothetical protein
MAKAKQDGSNGTQSTAGGRLASTRVTQHDRHNDEASTKAARALVRAMAAGEIEGDVAAVSVRVTLNRGRWSGPRVIVERDGS